MVGVTPGRPRRSGACVSPARGRPAASGSRCPAPPAPAAGEDSVPEDGDERVEHLARGCGEHRGRHHQPAGRHDCRDRLSQVKTGAALGGVLGEVGRQPVQLQHLHLDARTTSRQGPPDSVRDPVREQASRTRSADASAHDGQGHRTPRGDAHPGVVFMASSLRPGRGAVTGEHRGRRCRTLPRPRRAAARRSRSPPGAAHQGHGPHGGTFPPALRGAR